MGFSFLSRIRGLFIGLVALPFSIAAEPMIEVDSADFDLGTIREGELKTVKHTFKVKNTGDKPLVIQQVRPG